MGFFKLFLVAKLKKNDAKRLKSLRLTRVSISCFEAASRFAKNAEQKADCFFQISCLKDMLSDPEIV